MNNKLKIKILAKKMYCNLMIVLKLDIGGLVAMMASDGLGW